MKRTITLIAILSLVSLSALAQRRGSRNVRGGISIGNGDDIIRIDINNRSRSDVSLSRRVNKLERAVRQLQNMVYDLQDSSTDIPDERSYNCTARVCRQSASIHSASISNCKFFKMYSNESVRVYAFSGSEAERNALKKLNSDSDVKIIKEATLTCDENR